MQRISNHNKIFWKTIKPYFSNECLNSHAIMLIEKITLLIVAKITDKYFSNIVSILSNNCLKLSLTNIRSLRLNFVKCESFLESNFLTLLLYVRQTWMTQLILAICLRGVIFL